MAFSNSICTFCGTGCGNLLNVENNIITGVMPSVAHPVSRGRLCGRGWNVHDLFDGRNRLREPLVKNSSGSFEPVSYDRALALMLDRLTGSSIDMSEEIGFLGSPRQSNEAHYLFMKLARTVFNTSNISLDFNSGHRNSLDVLGQGAGFHGMLNSISDISKTELIIVAGFDITAANPIIGSEIQKAAESGADLVTIDAAMTRTASMSGRFHQLMPGSYRLVFALLARIILDEGLFDKNYIDSLTQGSEVFFDALSMMDIEWACERSGVSMEALAMTARGLADAESAMIFFPSGISCFDRDTVSFMYNLFVFSGKVGKEYSGVNPVASLNNLQGGYDMGVAPDMLTGYQRVDDDSVRRRFAGAWDTDFHHVPGNHVYDLMRLKEDGLKALVVMEHDDRHVWFSNRIKDLDFVVYIGSYENEFFEYADIVIPVCTFVEYDGTYTSTERRVQLAEKQFDSPDNIPSPWKLLNMISLKAGIGPEYGSAGEIMKEIAEVTPIYSGINYARLENGRGIQWPCNAQVPSGTKFFATDDISGRVRFVTYSGTFDAACASDRYPYLLMPGKAEYYWYQNNLLRMTHVPWREINATLLLYPEGFIEISKEDASALNARDRGMLRIESTYGSIELMARVSGDVRPGTALIPYFINDMAAEFLMRHEEILRMGENAVIPVNMVKL